MIPVSQELNRVNLKSFVLKVISIQMYVLVHAQYKEIGLRAVFLELTNPR